MVAGGTGPRLLAIGLSCPLGLQEGIKDGTYNGFSIVRILQATGSCFTSQCIIKLATLEEPLQAVVKSYTKSKLEAVELQQVELEIRLHQQLTDKHAVPFWMALEDTNQIHIISKFCSEGDLRQRLSAGLSAGPMSEAAVRNQITVPLLQILQDMHSKGFVHRDLKPENIFMGPDTVLLGDFGLAVATAQSPGCAAQPQQVSHVESAVDSEAVDDSSSNASTTCPMGTSSSGSNTTCSIHSCGSVGNSSLWSCKSAEPSFYPSSQSTLKRISVSSSDVTGMADCTFSPPVCSPDARLPGQGFRRISSAGSVQAWGSGALPLTPNMTAGGTPAYSSPEIVLAAFGSESGAAAVGPQNDIWALGVIAVECLTGQHPYGDNSMSAYAVMFSILQNQPLPLHQLSITEQCKDWLAQALQKDPSKRATAQQLLQHDWITMDLGNSDTAAGAAVQQDQQLQAFQEHASAPCRQLDCCTSEDLARLSGLTAAEYACTSSPFARSSCDQSGHRCSGVSPAVHHSSDFEAAACQGVKSLQFSSMQGISQSIGHQPTQQMGCKLQQHCSYSNSLLDKCRSSQAVVQCRLHAEHTAPSLALLSSIGSWED